VSGKGSVGMGEGQGSGGCSGGGIGGGSRAQCVSRRRMCLRRGARSAAPLAPQSAILR